MSLVVTRAPAAAGFPLQAITTARGGRPGNVPAIDAHLQDASGLVVPPPVDLCIAAPGPHCISHVDATGRPTRPDWRCGS